MKYVTIASDISNHPKTKTTTWACYIRHEGGVIKRSGQFKKYYSCPPRAESYALMNALAIAEKEVPSWSESKVTIHNEIEYVLDPITTKHGNVKKKDKDRAEAIRTVAIPILEKALSWERRKIKAHYERWETSENPAKYAINRWCDQEANRLMKQIRTNHYDKIKLEQSACV